MANPHVRTFSRRLWIAARGAGDRAVKWGNDEVMRSICDVADAWELAGEPVSLDHIIPLRGRHVSGLHVHENVSILPRGLNRRKSNTYAQS